MDSLPEEFFEELNELLKVQALEELISDELGVLSLEELISEVEND
jgi:hypothetical protein|tara:strand:- start:458 stop:592 length:135 start_codon:yes stop_codon:yes gene_type:complete